MNINTPGRINNKLDEYTVRKEYNCLLLKNRNDLMSGIYFQFLINVHDMITNSMNGNIHHGRNLIIGKSIN